MMPLGKLRTLALLAVASAGLLGGHSLTYLHLAPSSGDRSMLLAASGHGYMEKATVFTLAMAITAALFWVADGAFKSRRFRPTLGGTTLALGVVQVLGFSVQEILERFLAAAPMSGLGAVLLVGIPLQLLVAAVGALVVTALHKAGARIASYLSGRPERRVAPVLPLPRSVSYSSAILAGGPGSRGPPLLPTR